MILKLSRYYILLLLFIPVSSISQSNTDFYISNQGEDFYPGVSPLLPRKTISSSAPLFKNLAAAKGKVTVALQSGNIFKESLKTSYPIEVRTYPNPSDNNDFTILDGTQEFNSGWVKEPGDSYIFKQNIPYSDFISNTIGNYDYMYVFEIDRSLERTAPITARHPLQFASSIALLENTPGSFYISSNPNENPKPFYIHTSDGSSPNDNQKYRYEISTKGWAFNVSLQPNSHFENLWVRGFGSGYGSLQGGSNTTYNKIIFGPGAGVHNIVVRSGIVDHSLFLPAAKNANYFALVFYDVQGFNRHCTIQNSMFLDVMAPLYAHTSNGTNYGAVEMNHIVGFADTTNRAAFMYTANTDTVLLNEIYADGYLSGYHYGSAKSVIITNSYFKDIEFGIAYGNVSAIHSTIRNVFVKTREAITPKGVIIQSNTDVKIENSIIHIYNNNQSYLTNNGYFVYGLGQNSNTIQSNGNIFICDVHPSATLIAASTNTDNGIATSKDRWDNNVYILLRGNAIGWQTTNAATNNSKKVIDNFDEWKRQSGQDGHSLFFDLRNDPRGLRAIFQDPEHGNYELANTKEGIQVADLHAGMTSPLTCFLKKLSYEEAASLIKNSVMPSFNGCRNPCQQNTIRVNNTFSVRSIKDNQVTIQWNIAEQQNISFYELQRATVNSVFKRIGIIPVTTDSIYTFIDDVIPGTPYQYRLLLAAQASNACYSDIRSVKPSSDQALIVYPNPSSGKFLISMNGYTGKGSLAIFNSEGQTILKKDFFSIYAPLELNLISEPKGIYFIKLEMANRSYIQKLVIE